MIMARSAPGWPIIHFQLSLKLDFSVANGHFFGESVGPCGDQNSALYGEGAPREVDIAMFTALGEVEMIERIRDEILLLVPLLGDGNLDAYGKSARMNLKHKEGQLLWDSICTTSL